MLKTSNPWFVIYTEDLSVSGFKNTNNFEDLFPGDYPDFSIEKKDSTDITKLNTDEKLYIITEILARYGFIFNDSITLNYFSNKYWYSPTYHNVDSFLTPIETHNINLLMRNY